MLKLTINRLTVHHYSLLLSLVRESVRLGVSQLVQVWSACEVYHGRGPAQQDQVLRRGREQGLLDHLSVDKARAVGPALGRPVHSVPQLEPGEQRREINSGAVTLQPPASPVRMALLHLLQLFPQ